MKIMISVQETPSLEVKAVTSKPTKNLPKYQRKNSRSVKKSDKKAKASIRTTAVDLESGFTDEELALFEEELQSYKDQIIASSLEEMPSQHTMSDISNPFSGSEPYHTNINTELEHASRYVSSDESYSLHSEPISHHEAKSLLLSSERLYQHMLAASLNNSVHSDLAIEENVGEVSETELFQDDELPLIGNSRSSSVISGEIPHFTPTDERSTRRMVDPIARHLQESDDSDHEEAAIDENDETLIIFADDKDDKNFFVHETSPRFGKKALKDSKTTNVSNGKKTVKKQPVKRLPAKKPIVIPSKKVTPKPTETKKKVPNPRTVAPKLTKALTKGSKTEVAPSKPPSSTVEPSPIITKTPVAKPKSKPRVITPQNSKTLTVKPGITTTLTVRPSKTGHKPLIPVKSPPKTSTKPTNVSGQRVDAKNELETEVVVKSVTSPAATKPTKGPTAEAPKGPTAQAPKGPTAQAPKGPTAQAPKQAITDSPKTKSRVISGSKSSNPQTNLHSKALPSKSLSAQVNSIKPAGHSRTVARRPSQEYAQPKTATGTINPIATPDKFPLKNTLKVKTTKEATAVLTKTIPLGPITKSSLSTATNVTANPPVSESPEPATTTNMKPSTKLATSKLAISPKSKIGSKPASSSKPFPTPASKPTVTTPTSTLNKTLSPTSNLKHMEYKPKSKSTSPKTESKLPSPKIYNKIYKPDTASKQSISAKHHPKSSLTPTLSPIASSKIIPASKPAVVVATKSLGTKPSPVTKSSPVSKPTTNTPTVSLNKSFSPNLKQMEYKAKTRTTSPNTQSKLPSPKISSRPISTKNETKNETKNGTVLEDQNVSDDVMKPQRVPVKKKR